MTKLMEQLQLDPDAVFGFEAELPSGNRIGGTIGPMLNNKVCMNIQIAFDPTEEDLRMTKECAERMLGIQSEHLLVSRNAQEHEASMAAMRKFMGGGVG